MVPPPSLVLIDTDVFIRDLRYTRDREYATNKKFLELVADEKNGVTTIINLLEICGILSFNLTGDQLKELFYYFPERYQIEVLPIHSIESSLPDVEVRLLFGRIEGKMAFGDALIAAVAQKYIPGADLFVSWNAAYFQNLKIPALTPAQFMKR